MMRNRVLFVVILAVASFVTYIAWQKSIAQSQPSTPKPVVIIVGDSNSDMYSITDVQKWSEDYAITHAKDQTIINLSVGGHAVNDFNEEEKFVKYRAIAQKIPTNSPVILVSLLGTNNAIMMNKLTNSYEFIQQYSLLMNKLIGIFHPQAVMIGSLPPAYPLPGNKVPYSANFNAYILIHQFNEALATWIDTQPYINQTRLVFIPLLPERAYSTERIDEYLIKDGIHLNRHAQQILFDKISKAIEAELP